MAKIRNPIVVGGGKENLDTELNTQDTLLTNLETAVNSLEQAPFATIVTAELPNTTIKLYDSNSTLLDIKTTDTTTGGKVSFNVDNAGTYTITAFDSNNTQLWTNTVTVTADNLEYIVKSGKALATLNETLPPVVVSVVFISSSVLLLS